MYAVKHATEHTCLPEPSLSCASLGEEGQMQLSKDVKFQGTGIKLRMITTLAKISTSHRYDVGVDVLNILLRPLSFLFLLFSFTILVCGLFFEYRVHGLQELSAT